MALVSVWTTWIVAILSSPSPRWEPGPQAEQESRGSAAAHSAPLPVHRGAMPTLRLFGVKPGNCRCPPPRPLTLDTLSPSECQCISQFTGSWGLHLEDNWVSSSPSNCWCFRTFLIVIILTIARISSLQSSWMFRCVVSCFCIFSGILKLTLHFFL